MQMTFTSSFDVNSLRDGTWKGLQLKIKEKTSVGLTRQLNVIIEKFKLKSRFDIKLEHLVGQRIKVYWPKWKSWEACMVIAHEHNGKFWVKYDDVRDSAGTPYYLNHLLTGRPPQWLYLD